MNHASLQRVPQLGHLIKALSPLRRVAPVEEVADYIVLLSSSSASYINATGLTVDSGISMGIHVPGNK
jgi:NAD(P)-dependent dehydrogenase (short-subunit alcohol dehydrogenase family)